MSIVGLSSSRIGKQHGEGSDGRATKEDCFAYFIVSLRAIHGPTSPANLKDRFCYGSQEGN